MSAESKKTLKESRAPKRGQRLIWVFIGISLVITAAIIYFTSVTTELIITRKVSPIRATFVSTVTTDPSTNDAKGIFLVKTLGTSYTTEQLNGESKVSGHSEGTVTVNNTTTKPQPLMATTRFVTPQGTIFRSTERADVPAGGKINVHVIADVEGSEGDVPAQTKFTLPGLWQGLQDKIYATNDTAFSGGEKRVKLITEEDITSAKEQALKQLDQQAHEVALPDNAPQNPRIFVVQTDVLLAQASTPAGEQADRLTITVRARYIIIALDETAFEQSVFSKLSQQATPDEELATVNVRDVTMQIDRLAKDAQSVDVRYSVAGSVRTKKDSRDFSPEKFLQKSQTELTALTTTSTSIESIQAHFSPFWANRTPALENRLIITVR